MKTTLTEFNLNNEVRKNEQRTVRINTELIRERKNTLETDKELEKAEAILECQKEVYFDKLDTVNIKYWIGWRQYFATVPKIGKQYFLRFEKMTKSRGYSSITEIEEITEKMSNEMLADSYYY
jgi:glutamyl-tRNA reductase